jgi:outer membrane protein assembly factor BamB
VGDRIFTVNAMVQLRCLDKKSGEIQWSHDLMDEMGATHMRRGYGASPLAYKDLVILNVGGSQTGIAAFKQESGEIAWKGEGFRPCYASPLVIQFNNQDHIAAALGGDRVGLDPLTGETRWKTTVDMQSFGIMSTPIWIPPDKYFCCAGYGGGARLFQLKHNDDAYELEELWHYRKMQVFHGTMAHIDGMVIGSSHGSFGPAFLMAIDLESGKPLWRKRGLAKANVLYADGKLIVLDEQGYLYLGKATREGAEILSRCKMLEEKSWTVPTLVGTRLYLRDYHTIQCLELGADAH